MSLHYLWKHEPQKLCHFSYTMSQRHHCFGLLHIRQSSTSFNNFWQVVAIGFKLSYSYLIFYVRLLLLPYLLRHYEGSNDSFLTSPVVCQHADYSRR